ncbi:MAG TPA: Ig-like domain-containing protein [Solirubrobacteraceae bacterium]|nr:Ig-like domain-containing protein [Solirubrobacteraceae bacterium]
MSVSPTGQSVTVVCQTSFGASTAVLRAVFTPDPGSTVAGSRSATDSLQVGQDASVISLTTSKSVRPGASTTLTATVTPASSGPGPIQPSGTIEFLDGDQPIASCLGQGLVNGGATCTATFTMAGTHSITASYSGDDNFTGSISSAHAVRVVPAVRGTISSTMQWSFAYTPSYTKILTLVVNGAPAGSTVLVKCVGQGCPYVRHATAVRAQSRCGGKGKRSCSADPSLNLRRGFEQRLLLPGTTITVMISRPGWIGKRYTFGIRARRGPRIRISCVAPGGTRPGVGC